MEVGLRLPTLASERPAEGWGTAGRWAATAEEAGFDSLWCVDHLLAAQYVFGSASLEPLVTLGYYAGATTSIRLGVSVLIAPLRHRVWLAKQLGTLSALAGDRILLGLGAGWDEAEFAASDVSRGERGDRLDAVLEDVLTARERGAVDVDGVPIVPPPDRWAAVLMGGGGSATVQERGAPVRLAPRVARRIARSDGWFIRSSSPPELWRSELATILRIREELGRTGPFQTVRSCFLHVSEDPSPDAAVAEQVDAMRSIGWTGDAGQLSRLYPHGTVEQLQDWFRAAAATGIGHVVLHPVGALGQQIERVRQHLLPALTTTPVADLAEITPRAPGPTPNEGS